MLVASSTFVLSTDLAVLVTDLAVLVTDRAVFVTDSSDGGDSDEAMGVADPVPLSFDFVVVSRDVSACLDVVSVAVVDVSSPVDGRLSALDLPLSSSL